MSLLNWMFDIYQYSQIDKAKTDAAHARAELAAIRRSGDGINSDRLEQALGELALAVKTMQRMMVEKGVCTAEEFADRLKQIDLEDGRADGKAPV